MAVSFCLEIFQDCSVLIFIISDPCFYHLVDHFSFLGVSKNDEAIEILVSEPICLLPSSEFNISIPCEGITYVVSMLNSHA